jgi:predicted ATPase
LGHPLTLGYTAFWAALLHYHRRDSAATLEHVQAVIDLDRQQGGPYWVPFAIVLRGATRVRSGERHAGWADIDAGLAALRAAERELLQPYLLALQAELRVHQGEPEAALRLVRAALEQVVRKSEHWCTADLRRVEGECLWQLGDQSRAEEALTAGLRLAREQRARSYELRAALSLARFWHEQQRRPAARSLLEPLVASFGPDLTAPAPDLAAAAAFLAGL